MIQIFQYKIFLIIFYFSYLLAQTPYQFHLLDSEQLNRYEHNSIKGQIAHNAVIDIKSSSDSLYFFGTGNGLSYGEIIDNNSIDFGYFDISTMPRGGNPALAVDGNSIAVSGVIDTAVTTGTEPKGTGIAFSTDKGENWTYIPQSIDEIPETGQYHSILWGGQEISFLAVTTEINNVSYDLAIYDDYIYVASWAGGLRRYPIGLIGGNENRQWEIIPLPRDDDLDLHCGEIDTSYYLNPRDPNDDGYHNHKGFSVYVNDDIIWAGTAAGINKGEIDGNCINWVGHYSSWQNNISGNWVIGFTSQKLDNSTERLWAITWNADTQGEFSALSFTDDGGDTWNTTQPAGYPEKVYNLYANSNRIWAASESGLYVSEDGKHWGKYTRPIDNNTGEELLTESVMSVYFSDNDNWLWIGTEDGIAISDDDGISWSIHKFWKSTIYKDQENMLSAYPNPFLINDYNKVGGDGHVRFLYSNPNNYSGTIDIFDFAMDRVIKIKKNHTIYDESEVIWNGRNAYGDKVANGVYFCRLSINGDYYWTKLAVVN